VTVKAEIAGNFLTAIADAFLFIIRIISEVFSGDFEYREFFRQCYRIGNKTLPLISVTCIKMGPIRRPSYVPAKSDQAWARK